MAFTQITTTNITPNTVVSYAEYAAFTANVLPKISSVQYADDTFTVLDDTAANTSGTARLVINGSGFQSGATVIVGTTSASSTARVSSEQLRSNVTALSAASYTLYVQNPDGGTAIRVNGVTFSNTPVWGTAATLSNQSANTAFGVNISANSDSSITYSNTTALPAGTTLNSNGYFYGTVTIGVETNYTFSVKATDAENQDNTREFSLTVTVTPVQKLYVMGAGNNGVLGLSDTVSRSSPVQVGSGTTWSKMIGGFYHTLGIKSDGTLWSWGANADGQLGLGDVILRSSPVQVGTLTDWYDIACGRHHNLATRTNNTLWVWGNNSGDQLGFDATGTRRSSPTQVAGTSWSLVAAAAYSSFATRTDGTAWGWGQNAQGQLGLGNTAIKVSPTQIGTDTNWSKIRAWYSGTFGIKTNGTLYGWGLNNGGQLGLNNVTQQLTPTQIGTDTNWSDVRGGEGQAIAIRTNGTLWSIGGINSSGELGQNDTVRRSSPTQIGSGTNWSKISAGYNEYGAVKTDKTLWLWGFGSYGQLGQGDRTNRSSPVQVGTMTTWTDLGHSYFVTYGISE